MKPGKSDIPIRVKISGAQLEELQKHTEHMVESFGLDTKIEKYKGVKPISLYSWDVDCILDVLDFVLNDKEEYPDKNDEGYIALKKLYTRIENERQKIGDW